MSYNPTPSPTVPTNLSQDPLAVLSPTRASHALPSKPEQSSSTPTQQSTESSTTTLQQPPPRMRGGFELDDDDEEEDNDENEEDDEFNAAGQDDSDVYDPAVSFKIDDQSSESAHDVTLDRNSQSPDQENGITPVPVQNSDSHVGFSSALPDSVSELRASTNTPTRVSVHAQDTLPSSNSKGLLSTTVPKSRLANDIVGILEDRIKDDPRGDIPAWLELIEEFKGRNKVDDVRRTYNRYLEVFPLAAEQWCEYVRWEEQHNKRFEMEQIFGRALLQVPNIEFWSIYINYIRRRNSMQSGNVAQAYKIINQSFTFCLDKVGMDKDSGQIWQDYIDFLKTGPGTVGGAGWEDKQKMDTLREAYQKALCVPTSALLSLWKEYDAFETGLSKINGRKFLQERSPAYMTARTAYTQLQNITRDLIRTSRPRLPPLAGYAGDTEFVQQVKLWQQWIQWEKDDNLVLKDEDVNQYNARIMFTYRQALAALQFWPEMWYDVAEFCFANNMDAEGLSLLNQGFNANGESPLLAFKVADRIESTTSNDEGTDPGAKARMAKVREPYTKVLDALYAIEKKAETKMQLDIQNAELYAGQAANGDANADEDLNASNVTAHKAAMDAQIDAIRLNALVHVDMLSKIISHVWIALMRATRRIQGKGLPNEKGAGFRAVFNEARKRGKLTSDFYVESAQIEWQCYRDPTGTRILERGVKLYPEDSHLPLEYIKHLVGKDDLTNARAVFETTVNRFLTANKAGFIQKTKPLFAFFHGYEAKYGELSQTVRLETRMQELFPEDPRLQEFAARYSTTNFDPMAVHPIISSTQTQPKSTVHPSIEISDIGRSPIQKTIDAITTNSPKRPLSYDDNDDFQPRKILRAESPLKGAAGRRMNQQQQQQSQPQQPQQPARSAVSFPVVPPPLPPQVTYLLTILPKASLYTDTRFDAVKIVELIRECHLPPPMALGGPRPPQPPPPQQTPQQQSSVPVWPPQFSQHQQATIPQSYMPPGVTQPSYGAAPYRFT